MRAFYSVVAFVLLLELTFGYDESVEKGIRIEELLDQIKSNDDS